jgi:hypothetical protein
MLTTNRPTTPLKFTEILLNKIEVYYGDKHMAPEN